MHYAMLVTLCIFVHVHGYTLSMGLFLHGISGSTRNGTGNCDIKQDRFHLTCSDGIASNASKVGA